MKTGRTALLIVFHVVSFK